MSRPWFHFAPCVLVACASGHYATVDPGHPAFVIPHHIAEGTGEGSDLPERSSAPGPASAPELAHLPPPFSGGAPDPEPLRMAEQWQLALLYRAGELSVEHFERRTFPKPVVTARHMGRFAVELWIGHELIERVRFDFPLLAAEERPGITRRPLHDPPSLSPNAVSRISVLVPASPRATRLVLVDRAAQKSRELTWPPDAEPPAVEPSPGLGAPHSPPPS